MPRIQDSIEVQVPVQQAYNQWTQFEDFPKFMEGIQSVQQLDDTHVHWVAEIRGETLDGRRRSPSSGQMRRSPGRRPTARSKTTASSASSRSLRIRRASTFRWTSKASQRSRTL
jgi:hypothetical protein